MRDVWEEKDEYGVVRFATVQTVSIYLCTVLQKFVLNTNLL